MLDTHNGSALGWASGLEQRCYMLAWLLRPITHRLDTLIAIVQNLDEREQVRNLVQAQEERDSTSRAQYTINAIVDGMIDDHLTMPEPYRVP